MFGSHDFQLPEKFGGIQIGHYGMDYLPNNLPNLLPYGPPRGRNYKRSKSKLDNIHFDITSTEITKKAYEIAKGDYLAYLACKEKYSYLDKATKENCMFDFLCFLLSGRHTNAYIVAHFGSR